jgi:hypothetical protein
MPAHDDVGPWCMECAWPSAILGRSLDPDHPVGVCGRATLEHPGCGHVLLTYDRAEAERVFSVRRRKLTTAQHKRHRPADYPVTYCTGCDRYAGTLALDPA